MSATPPSHPSDRRPIAARKLGIVQSMASILARVGVTPNSISVSSMFFAAIACAALIATPHVTDTTARLLWLVAAAGIQARLMANLLDGLVAVEGGKRTPVGELYNEVPDRVSDSLVLIGAGYALTGQVEAGYLAALMAIMTAYVRAVGKGAGVGSDFGGPMAKQQRMAIITIGCVYLACAPQSWRHEVIINSRSFGILGIALVVITFGAALTSVLRLLRIAKRLYAGHTT